MQKWQKTTARLSDYLTSVVFCTGGRHDVRWRTDSRCDNLGVDDALRLLRLLPYCSHVENKEGVPHSAEVQDTLFCFSAVFTIGFPPASRST